jgi:hypothetical protein
MDATEAPRPNFVQREVWRWGWRRLEKKLESKEEDAMAAAELLGDFALC